MCDDKMDILNRIAGRISNYVKNIGIAGEPGTWNFSLYHHRKEVWYVAKDGTIADIIIAVYENLISGEWEKHVKETRK